MAAALSAYEAGVQDIYILERDNQLGGILPQCIHDGFGTFTYGEMLTGPEYAQRDIDAMKKTGIKVKLNTMVLEITKSKEIVAASKNEGLLEFKAKAIVLSMGCRERTRFQIGIPGYRPAGVFTAGTAQRYINIEGLMPAKCVVVLGSGDIGLIMARRLTLEGASVEGVYEILPTPSGLSRNVVQCLEDYGIPLHLSHTIVDIKGKKRVEGVTVAKVDDKMNPIAGTERYIPCDTVILSVGLIPENELSKQAGVALDRITGGPVVDEMMQTSAEGFFACGNVVHVHDLVDDVTSSGKTAGNGAAIFIRGETKMREKPISVVAGENVRYAVPELIKSAEFKQPATLYFRVKCPGKNMIAKIRAGKDGEVLAEKRERIVNPPEMIRIELKPEQLQKLGEKDVYIEVVPAPAPAAKPAPKQEVKQ
ncbi:MAG: FAD-dependent oxidoreductase [Candidatus Thermoplasmatota archaeon]|nr:FAD-dependent oxidoreductase [Candidatus Thermoplasmatota archaeon]